MAFLLAQAGTTLYKVDVSTGTATALTLPTGVTLSSTRKPKFALLNQWVAMVNSPTTNLLIDPEGTVTPMVPKAPTRYPRVATGSGTGLTGAYMYAVSFIVKNSDGALLFESPIGPPSVAVTATNNDFALTIIPKSSESFVTGRRVYRTLTGGASSVMFHLFDIDDNTTLSINDNAPDATLTLLPSLASTLVSPPGTMAGLRFKNIVQWKSRFFAVADDPSLVDTVYASETNKVYAWPNTLVAYPTGQTEKGVIAFAPRRNSLGFLKANGVWTLNASSSSTGIAISNSTLNQIDGSDKQGCVAEDSVIVVGGNAYWLGRNAFYEWSDNGIVDVSSAQVKPWFNSSAYFNRSRFQYAFSRYNEVTNSIELHLAATGASTEERWVSFNLNNRKWYGPHKTGALTPTHGFHLVDANGLPMTIVGGSDGVLYTGNSSNQRDGAATAIDMDCYGPWHHGGDPDKHHTWLQLSLLSKVESAGTAEVTPYLGVAPGNASAQTAMTATLTLGRELLNRIGFGAVCRLRIRKNTVNQSMTLYGYELPWFTNGRR
jgi:hypothetical protein